MATERVKLDTRGKNILELFMENMPALGAINKLAADGAQVGTYASGEGDININQPKRNVNYGALGREPGPQEKYFVREISIDPIVERGDYGMDRRVTTRRENLVTYAENETPEMSSKMSNEGDHFSGRSSTDLLRNYGLYSFEHGRNPQDFMRLKGRKSLYTLFQETMDAFYSKTGQPVYRNPAPVSGRGFNDPKITNRYDAGERGAYDYKFMENQGPSFIDAPTELDIQIQAIEGFNAGQVMGSADVTFQQRVRTASQDMTRTFFEGLAASMEPDSVGAEFFNFMTGVLAPASRISQLYVPGWVRPAENWLSRKPLAEVLYQNLLLPPGVHGNNNNGAEPPGHSTYESTFQSLYTRNRSGAAGGTDGKGPFRANGSSSPIANEVFMNGVLGGSAINLLQEPVVNMNEEVITGAANPKGYDMVPFSFEEDDAEYLTWAKRDSGFRSNTEVSTTQPSKLNQAVRDYETTNVAGNLGGNLMLHSQGQAFPFVFSTVNKITQGTPRWQICYLQAIINSLSESYAPVWASRHFFGRSEQAHTYTFTDRTIDLGFTIFANSMRQLQNVYERVAWLAQQCYPDYDNTNRMLNGPIVAMRIGDLFQYKTGIIKNLSYDWMFNGGKWEVTSGVRMPQGCTVTISYQVIHENLPTRDTDFYGGPGGGLNAATNRYREITAGQLGTAFDAFDQTTTHSAGYGQRFIPRPNTSNPMGEGVPWVEKMKAYNDYTGNRGNDKSTRDVWSSYYADQSRVPGPGDREAGIGNYATQHSDTPDADAINEAADALQTQHG